MRWYSVTDPTAPDPVRLPSVTTILDVTMPQSRRDTLVRSEMANPTAYALKREAAIARGIACDRWFKQCLTTDRLLGAPASITPQCKRLIPLVRSILREARPVWADQQVHSIPMGYAGTLDVVATLPLLGNTLLELKTTAYTIWPEAVAEAQLQAIAYALAWDGMHPESPIDAIATVHVSPYMIHTETTNTPAKLAKLTAAWHLRRKHFASRFSQMEL